MKKRFIDAYIYCYGGTRKQAENVYKNAGSEYIKAVIASYEIDAKKAFFND